mgnify:FL=1
MKKGIYSLFLLSSCLLISCKESKKQDDNTNENNNASVIVMLGQSNMEGHTYSKYLSKTMGEEKANEYTKGYDDIKISYKCSMTLNSSNDEFVNVKLGEGTSVNQFGPEVGLAEYFHKENKENIFIIKFAQGATSIFNQWAPRSLGKPGALYASSVEYVLSQVQKLEDMGYYPEIKAICWMQGEDDSNNDNYAQYGKYQRALMKDLREDFLYYSRVGVIGFIDAGISDSMAWVHQKEINAQKEEISKESELNYYFSTIENKLKYNGEPAGSPDIYHYDSSSMIKLGNLFAEGVNNFLD